MLPLSTTAWVQGWGPGAWAPLPQPVAFTENPWVDLEQEAGRQLEVSHFPGRNQRTVMLLVPGSTVAARRLNIYGLRPHRTIAATSHEA